MKLTKCRPQAWLKALFNGNVKLIVCRYNARIGMWHSQHTDKQQHFMTFVEQGPLQFRVDGNIIEVNAGEMLWMQPGSQIEVLGCPIDQQVRHINVRFVLKHEDASVRLMRDYIHVRPSQSIRHQLNDFLEYVEDPGPFPELQLRHLIAGLALSVLRTSADDRQPDEIGLYANQRHHLQRYIADHILEGIGPAELANHMGLSLDYFTRCFKKAYGIAPRQYLVEERMRLAAIQLVESTDAVKAVASRVGMDDCNYFCRQFKKVIGSTPMQFRKRGSIPRQLQ